MYKIETFKFKRIKKDQKLLGYVTLSIENRFLVNCQVRITGNYKDIWVKMPSRSTGKNKSINLFSLIKKDESDAIQSFVKNRLRADHEYLFSPDMLTSIQKQYMQKARTKSRFGNR